MSKYYDFYEAVLYSRLCLGQRTGVLTSAIGVTLYDALVRGDDVHAFLGKMISKAEANAACFDDLIMVATGLLRTAPEKMPPELRRWAADALDKKSVRPTRGRRSRVGRAGLVVGLVAAICERYPGINPTRSRSAGDECCRTGGSACDAIGLAINAYAKRANWICETRGFDTVKYGVRRYSYSAIEAMYSKHHARLEAAVRERPSAGSTD